MLEANTARAEALGLRVAPMGALPRLRDIDTAEVCPSVLTGIENTRILMERCIQPPPHLAWDVLTLYGLNRTSRSGYDRAHRVLRMTLWLP